MGPIESPPCWHVAVLQYAVSHHEICSATRLGQCKDYFGASNVARVSNKVLSYGLSITVRWLSFWPPLLFADMMPKCPWQVFHPYLCLPLPVDVATDKTARWICYPCLSSLFCLAHLLFCSLLSCQQGGIVGQAQTSQR